MHAAAPALCSPPASRRGETDAADFFSDAAEFDATAAPLSLRALGLPTSCVDAYAKAGIRQVWQWQLDALALPGVLTGAKNLIFSTPTSSGKSLVAEIVSILSVKRSGKLALFVVPFVAIAEEKLAFFRKVLKGSGIRCEGYYGDVGPTRDSRLVLPRRDEHGRNCIAVCILEKADRLLLQLGAEDCLHELCVVVIDELHQIGLSRCAITLCRC
jgi:DNA polymerase theta